jgi:hypothetical protein
MSVFFSSTLYCNSKMQLFRSYFVAISRRKMAFQISEKSVTATERDELLFDNGVESIPAIDFVELIGI